MSAHPHDGCVPRRWRRKRDRIASQRVLLRDGLPLGRRRHVGYLLAVSTARVGREKTCALTCGFVDQRGVEPLDLTRARRAKPSYGDSRSCTSTTICAGHAAFPSRYFGEAGPRAAAMSKAATSYLSTRSSAPASLAMRSRSSRAASSLRLSDSSSSHRVTAVVAPCALSKRAMYPRYPP